MVAFLVYAAVHGSSICSSWHRLHKYVCACVIAQLCMSSVLMRMCALYAHAHVYAKRPPPPPRIRRRCVAVSLWRLLCRDASVGCLPWFCGGSVLHHGAAVPGGHHRYPLHRGPHNPTRQLSPTGRPRPPSKYARVYTRIAVVVLSLTSSSCCALFARIPCDLNRCCYCPARKIPTQGSRCWGCGGCWC